MSERALVNHQLPASVTLKGERNGLIMARSLDFRAERHDHPGLAELREREGLSKITKSGSEEFEKMRLLCEWTNSQWEKTIPNPYPPWDANQILAMIRSGRTGGFCAQYAVLLVQSCLSMGWQARYLEICPKEKSPGSCHFTAEVWSNQYNRWAVLDPFFDCYFEKGGMPLSALDIHEAIAGDRSESINIVRGKGKYGRTNSKASDDDIKSLFYHLAVDMRTNHLQDPFNFWDRRDTYMSWRDRFTGGIPEIFRRFSSDPLDFNFPMNQVQVRLEPGSSPDMLTCLIRTNMPNVLTLEVRHDEGEWIRPPSPYDYRNQGSILGTTLSRVYGSVVTYHWKLKPGHNKINVRAVNGQGVTGPPSFLWVIYEPGKNSDG